MRHLILIRHGKAQPKLWDEGSTEDHARRLEPQGIAQARATGAWLRAQNIKPNHILCSTADRAIETAKAVLEGMGLQNVPTTFHGDIYYRDVSEIIKILHGAPHTAQTVLIVGHNPTIPETALHLDDAQTPAIGKLLNYGFALAGAAWLTTNDDWTTQEAGKAKLKAYYDPSQEATAGSTSASAR